MRKVISFKNEPTKLPVYQTMVCWLLMDRLHSPVWMWGAIGMLFLFIWIASIYSMSKQKQVNIFED